MAVGTQTMWTPWHARSTDDTARDLDVDPRSGLSQAAARRLERDGPKRLDEAPREPCWRALLRQFQDLLILVLLAAAVASLAVSREWKTPVVIVLVAGTMRFVTFVFLLAFNLLTVRHAYRSVFTRDTIENTSAFVAIAAVVVLLVLLVEMDVLHEFFTTTDLSSAQWLTCLAVCSSVWVSELVKLGLRARFNRARASRARRRQGA